MSNELVWNHFIEVLQHWVEVSPEKSKECSENKNYFGFFSNLPAPLFNGVIQKTSAALRDLDKQILFFLKWPITFTWWIDPSIHLPKDGKLLEAKGLNPAGAYSGITAPVKTFDLPAKKGIEVKEIASLKELETWTKILGPNFNFDPPFMKRFSHLMRDFGPGKRYRHYLGYLNGKPVGVVSLFLAKDKIAGIWNLGVIPEARRCGVATQLLQSCMNEAAQQGCTISVAILAPSPETTPLFAKFGFQESCRLIPYVFGYNPN